MLTFTDSEASISSPHLPTEILQYTVSFIDDLPTLKAVCLTSNAFVFRAQAKLFACLSVTDTSPDNVQSLTSSPHIFQHFRSLIADIGNSQLLSVLDVFAQTKRLRELTFTSHMSSFTTPLIRSLHGNTLPFLTSLALDKIEAPLFIVTLSTSLRSLRLYWSVLYKEGDEGYRGMFSEHQDPLKDLGIPSSVESESMLHLTTLALDITRNAEWNISPLIELIQRGNFPALKCLDFTRCNSIWFPLEDWARIGQPLMHQLVCLDIDYWPYWDDEGNLNAQNLDIFHIYNYPCLLFFSISLQRERDPDRDVEYNQLVRRLEWLMDGLEKLTSPHPLKFLRLNLAADWQSEIDNDRYNDERPISRGIWGMLDDVLTLNQHVEKLEKVIIPIHPTILAMRKLLEESLPMLTAAKKVSFELIDTAEYFTFFTQTQYV
ncbi:hypothetical protein DL96DRAFT_1820421 [Flagelloscypha sp. PMI_526]|nr:hypothetical protein DL96DRAFT_1820421 [Flagelloscypha sp. PMI_526]